VTADPVYTLEEVTSLLSAAARSPYRKVFTCAPDVIIALRERIPPASPDPVYLPGLDAIRQLMAVDITENRSFGPGHFQLVQHSSCSADQPASEVLHGNCPVIACGSLFTRVPGEVA
jgi:hypothetical protein